MAPSMVGYYLSDMCAGLEESYINKRNIQQIIYCDEYNIYLDYNDDIYLELLQPTEDEYETGSLW